MKESSGAPAGLWQLHQPRGSLGPCHQSDPKAQPASRKWPYDCATTRTHTHTLHARAHIHVYTHKHIHTQTHTHTHTHTHTFFIFQYEMSPVLKHNAINESAGDAVLARTNKCFKFNSMRNVARIAIGLQVQTSLSTNRGCASDPK